VTDTNEVRRQLTQLLAEFADPRDDEHWAQWLRVKPHGADDLVAILRAPARSSIKARALLALLAPSLDLLPFSWFAYGSHEVFSRGLIEFERLNQQLLEFTFDVIQVVLPLVVKSEYATNRSCQHYWYYLRELLARLPAGVIRDRVLESYELRLPLESFSFGGPQAYEPFESLMWHPEIPTDVKMRTDQRMRGLIEAEENGTTNPRIPAERALVLYTGSINFLLGSEPGDLRYDPSILAEQIRFLLDLAKPGAFHLFFADTLVLALCYVSDPELRTRLVRDLVLGNLGCNDSQSCGRLSARSTAGMELAWELRLMFEGDDEITSALDRIIADGQKFVGIMDQNQTWELERAATERAAMANFSQ
jgi:hypothetical protein